MRDRNSLLGIALGLGMVSMAGLSFAAVPLYRVFCQATGYNGTPKIGPSISPGSSGQSMNVRFDANTSHTLPWTFSADKPALTVSLGDEQLATYTGRNDADHTVTGVATYNVTPDKAAQYFHKTACFCFNEQTLAAGQTTSFPLSFWVDPAIRTDPDTKDVRTITLSYTFFRSADDAARSGGFDHAGPHVGPRADAGSSVLNPQQFPR